ncbi:MAG TPA: sugar-binding protein, partial [Chryseolinea sp.]
EIQLFIANEGPYTQTEEQEITLFRSKDNGLTWTGGETVSFREGHRDGMPVPLLLKNHREIILAIEDNGVQGKEFKPMIIRTTANDDWNNIPVSGSSVMREYAMDQSAAIPEKKYAGAPYIRQLTPAEVVLSYQGNELRKDFQWDRSDMIVAIGSENGKNFNRKSTPFYIADPSKTALWNSLCVEDDSTVIALSSTNAYGKMAVWMIKGRVLGEIRSSRQSITIDGKTNERLWKTKAPVFIGGFGRTNANINCAWNADKIFFTAVINDGKVVSSAEDAQENDALQFFLDPQNQSTELPDENIFCLTVTASGKYIFKEGKKGSWTDRNATGIEATSVADDSGYHIEVAIPWTALNTVPEPNQRMGFHAALIETSNGRQHSYVEPLAGNISDAPYTWSPLFLIESL